jgi:hypothetical protein
MVQRFGLSLSNFAKNEVPASWHDKVLGKRQQPASSVTADMFLVGIAAFHRYWLFSIT